MVTRRNNLEGVLLMGFAVTNIQKIDTNLQAGLENSAQINSLFNKTDLLSHKLLVKENTTSLIISATVILFILLIFFMFFKKY